MAKPIQIKKIHAIKSALQMDDGTYRALLEGFGVASSKDLRDAQAELLVRDLERKAIGAGVWKQRPPAGKGKRPHNLGTGRTSREAQLKKVEALLTVGGKSWEYADALALRICKVEKMAWVADNDLYRIITALRLQAKREGWDLSGER